VRQLIWRFAQGVPSSALPPEVARFDFGRQDARSPFRDRSYLARWRAIEGGYQTLPADCPPVRAISAYGFIARSPGTVRVRRASAPRRERLLGPGRAAFDVTEIEGDEWPDSDSGLVASWIMGSEFVKVQTGIELLFPNDVWLMQSSLPNRSLQPRGSDLDVMSGVEPPSSNRREELDGHSWTVSPLNIIVRVPPAGRDASAGRGDALAWFFPRPDN
jgi:hypothetical protein